MHFTSDIFVVGDGFILNWECYTPSNTNGIIELDGYENNHFQEWEILSECTMVEISSRWIDLENGFDFLDINGQSYSGQTEISQVVPANFIVSFQSDSSQSGDGFSLFWECYDVPPSQGSNGQIIVENYNDNHDQSWNVNTDCEKVLIQSELFETEQERIEIYRKTSRMILWMLWGFFVCKFFFRK